MTRWHRQLHIFLYPFYYIEYGIAQLGALQIWRNSLDDEAAALAAYRAGLGLGATRSLPEIYAEAGARLIFDAEGLAELVTLVEQQIEAGGAGDFPAVGGPARGRLRQGSRNGVRLYAAPGPDRQHFLTLET